MDERETSPLLKLIEENRAELVSRMIDANIGAGGYEKMSPRAASVASKFMNRILDSVASWLREYSVRPDGFLVALDYEQERGHEVPPEEAIARVNQTLGAIATFAAERFGPGARADNAARQIRAATAVARLVVASETVKRTNQRSRVRAE